MRFSRSFRKKQALAVCLGGFTGAFARITLGIIEGVITDPQGAEDPEIAVTITSADTNVTTTKTNNTGYYQVAKFHA